MSDQPKVMIVEDDDALSAMLTYNLEAAGFGVEVQRRGDDAEEALRERVPDVLILDLMLPGLSGIELCRRLRVASETRRLPIIILTARGEETERVRGLDAGADDYVVKPFSTPELIARVKANVRRTRPELLDNILCYNDLTMDRTAHRVYRKGREVRLGPTEYKLLELFLQNPDRVFSRAQLIGELWANRPDVDDRTVDVQIGRLRKAIGIGKSRDLIRTVRGTGYALQKV